MDIPEHKIPQGIMGLSDDGTGYVSVSGTPNERCLNCEHFVQDEFGCNGPKMRKMSNRPRLPDGNVQIEPYGWCRFWDEK